MKILNAAQLLTLFFVTPLAQASASTSFSDFYDQKVGRAAARRVGTQMGTCFIRFNQEYHPLSQAQREHMFRAISAAQMKCLYRGGELRQHPEARFFVPRSQRPSQFRVQRFLGRNSLSAFRDFEKIFFTFVDDGLSPPREIFGFNDSTAGRLSLSPGFFKVDFSGPQTVLDYTGDLEKQIDASDWERLRHEHPEIPFKEVRNNDGNLLFGELRDRVYLVNPDVLIGAAYRRDSHGDEQKVSFFLLKRQIR